MYDYIKGTLVSKNTPHIVVETSGIGYLILSNQRTIDALPELSESVKIYTKLIHKEDAMTLCGFLNKEDRVIFDTLTTVSGIGTKVALTLLDEFETSELIGAVIDGDYKFISRAKGVGPKLAQKIILELKDKLSSTKTTAELLSSRQEGALGVSCEVIEEVQTILNSLGYDKSEYSRPLDAALKSVDGNDSQELLRTVLQLLSKGVATDR
ncbi:Holliday junction DNA helicase RuvA [Candidatus Gastranaerophilus sp. (ex Termes propinquus)]|nr:Holliday junction DNA helicase RuvA [Candidatus Gastranaerophilus sp. (ex Termes propinquus)]